MAHLQGAGLGADPFAQSLWSPVSPDSEAASLHDQLQQHQQQQQQQQHLQHGQRQSSPREPPGLGVGGSLPKPPPGLRTLGPAGVGLEPLSTTARPDGWQHYDFASPRNADAPAAVSWAPQSGMQDHIALFSRSLSSMDIPAGVSPMSSAGATEADKDGKEAAPAFESWMGGKRDEMPDPSSLIPAELDLDDLQVGQQAPDEELEGALIRALVTNAKREAWPKILGLLPAGLRDRASAWWESHGGLVTEGAGSPLCAADGALYLSALGDRCEEAALVGVLIGMVEREGGSIAGPKVLQAMPSVLAQRMRKRWRSRTLKQMVLLPNSPLQMSENQLRVADTVEVDTSAARWGEEASAILHVARRVCKSAGLPMAMVGLQGPSSPAAALVATKRLLGMGIIVEDEAVLWLAGHDETEASQQAADRRTPSPPAAKSIDDNQMPPQANARQAAGLEVADLERKWMDEHQAPPRGPALNSASEPWDAKSAANGAPNAGSKWAELASTGGSQLNTDAAECFFMEDGCLVLVDLPSLESEGQRASARVRGLKSEADLDWHCDLDKLVHTVLRGGASEGLLRQQAFACAFGGESAANVALKAASRTRVELSKDSSHAPEHQVLRTMAMDLGALSAIRQLNQAGRLKGTKTTVERTYCLVSVGDRDFVDVVTKALDLGHPVELWAFRTARAAAYKALAEAPNKFSIYFLDDHVRHFLDEGRTVAEPAASPVQAHPEQSHTWHLNAAAVTKSEDRTAHVGAPMAPPVMPAPQTQPPQVQTQVQTQAQQPALSHPQPASVQPKVPRTPQSAPAPVAPAAPTSKRPASSSESTIVLELSGQYDEQAATTVQNLLEALSAGKDHKTVTMGNVVTVVFTNMPHGEFAEVVETVKEMKDDCGIARVTPFFPRSQDRPAPVAATDGLDEYQVVRKHAAATKPGVAPKQRMRQHRCAEREFCWMGVKCKYPHTDAEIEFFQRQPGGKSPYEPLKYRPCPRRCPAGTRARRECTFLHEDEPAFCKLCLGTPCVAGTKCDLIGDSRGLVSAERIGELRRRHYMRS